MDKNAIKTFAVESRRKMIESVKYQASLIGITSDGNAEPIFKADGMETYDFGAGQHTIYDEDIIKRESLIREISKNDFNSVMEQVAYTWFNRIIAIRFLEVNDYLPTRTRVLSSETEGKIEPDIITYALDIDLDYSNEDKEKIINFKEENKYDDLFHFLFVKQCNKLNDILPGLFEKTDDYMELLFNIKFTDEKGVIRQLIEKISEEDFGEQVEIIGWIYQFYNSELKEETFADLKKGIKITKEKIPAATQLFTPDWIVKYMVENSIGKLWLEVHPNIELQNQWKYYVEEAEQEPEVEKKLSNIRKEISNLKIEDLKIIDPCMGSGHILVYVFDVLMQIYISEGFTKKDAVISILKNNLYGLDIDDRAYQLSYFAIMMKAREYDPHIFKNNLNPLIYSFQETDNISNDLIEYIISKCPEIKNDILSIINLFKNAKEYGSILDVKTYNFEKLLTEINNILIDFSDLYSLKFKSELNLLKNIILQAKMLNSKYDVVVTNPPYMGNNGMNKNLKEFLKSNYPLTKMDLFAVFIEKGLDMIKEYGFNCMVTMQSWMFLSSFEKFRKKLIETTNIINLLHMDNMVMRIAFGTSATIFRKLNIVNFNSTFYHVNLSDINNDIVDPLFFNENNRFISNKSKFTSIPGCPIAYWADENIINSFKKGKPIKNISDIKQGLKTADNNRFLRKWYEINFNDIGFGYKSTYDSKLSKLKWFPYNKGGDYRKWYGNHQYVVNWFNDGFEIKNFKDSKGKVKSRPQNLQFYFKKSISWSTISSGNISFRIYPEGFIFDGAGSSIFVNENVNYIIGLLNSEVSKYILSFLSPTIGFEIGQISLIPIIFDLAYLNKINSLVDKNVSIVSEDWDDYELSWNFKVHPLLRYNSKKIKLNFIKWEDYKNSQFFSLKENEINLNEFFSKIYNVSIDNIIEDKYISVTKANYEKDIKSFISYAVGCMFGRYSLDEEGLQFAGGEFNINNYSKFIPDDDNIIPVLDTEYFNDDIVGRFVEFVKVCFGEETLEENLDFIAGALKKKGKTSREIIRNYFLTDFFKDHAQTYKKCPIYWQFDSGRQNAFKCLIYMHRYEPGLVARVRTDYLHKTQKAIEQNLAQCENIIANSSNKSEISKAKKDKTKYIKQLDEIKVYDEALAHIANQRIEIDLDDGVKVNHAKFQNVEISKEGQKAKKINLLKKI